MLPMRPLQGTGTPPGPLVRPAAANSPLPRREQENPTRARHIGLLRIGLVRWVVMIEFLEHPVRGGLVFTAYAVVDEGIDIFGQGILNERVVKVFLLNVNDGADVGSICETGDEVQVLLLWVRDSEFHRQQVQENVGLEVHVAE